MLDDKFLLLLINFMWMAGLFGALFSLVYMAQYRHKHWWRMGYTSQVPRTLAPLYGSLALFVIGLALHAFAAGHFVALSLAVVWGLLACYFLFRVLELVIAGVQDGWDTPEFAGDDEDDEPAFPIGIVAASLLLVVNIGFLAWWGMGQAQAGTLDLTRLTQVAQPVADVSLPAIGGVTSWLTGLFAPVRTQFVAWGWSAADNTTDAPPDSAPAAAMTVVPKAALAAKLTVFATPITTTVSITSTPTALPTATPTASATATATTSPTPLPTHTPLPTATPLPTDTPLPTATPLPTKTATATATPRPTATATPVIGSVTLVTPLDNEAGGDRKLFQWAADFTPGADYAFELIFWRPDQDPMRNGFGLAAPTTGDRATVDLATLDDVLGERLEPGSYQWGVLLVRTTPAYERIRYLGGGWRFIYQR